MPSPLEHIMNWYSNLSPRQREDVAFLVGTALPGSAIEIDADAIAELFVSEINRLNTSPRRGYGLALCLRTSVEHFIISRRSTAENWDTAKWSLQHLAERTGEETFREKAAEIDFKAAQWIASCKKWQEMAALHLTDESLNIYYVDLVRPNA